MGQISLEPRPPDVRITATRMIIEGIAVSASPSIETPSAPGRANVTGSGPAEK
jgi:hypothetical protein